MPLVINTNVGSLNAQRNLVKSGMEMSNAMERLSSGLRINTAADDAAGLAITNRMSSQVRGLDQAVRNANDGISMIATAEGALSETTNIMQRMRELAVQSSNGIYSDSDRATLNAEVEQLKEELNRIAETTSFNGQNILDGSQKSIDLQVGANAGQTINFGIESFDTKSLGGSSSGDIVGTESKGTSDMATQISAGDVYVNGQDLGAVTAGSTMSTILSNFNSNISGVEFSAFTEMTAEDVGTGRITGTDVLDITFTDIDGNAQTYKIGDTASLDELAAKITDVTGGVIEGSVDDSGKLNLTNADGGKIALSFTGLTAAEFKTATGWDSTSTDQVTGEATLVMTSTNGEDIIISSDAAGTTALAKLDAESLGIDTRLKAGDITAHTALTDTASATDKLNSGELVINGVEIGASSVDSGAGNRDAVVAAINKSSADTGVVASHNSGVITLNSVDGSEISVEFLGTLTERDAIETKLGFQESNKSSSVGQSVADLDISTAVGAQKAIDTIDAALEQVNSQRSKLGAVNNRLDFTVSNLMNVSENTSAARSRILDADFAKETAALSKAQVLQQASSAMLAQANAAPQQVLSLLR